MYMFHEHSQTCYNFIITIPVKINTVLWSELGP